MGCFGIKLLGFLAIASLTLLAAPILLSQQERPSADVTVDTSALDKAIKQWEADSRQIDKGLTITFSDSEFICTQGKRFLSFFQGPHRTEIFGANERYEFRIQRADPSQEWHMAGLNFSSRDDITNDTLLYVLQDLQAAYQSLHVNLGGIGFGTYNLMATAKNPKFKITDSSSELFQGVPSTKLTFEYDNGAKSTDDEVDFPASGAVWIDESNGWSILGYDWQLFRDIDDRYLMKGRLSDFVDVNGLRLPTQLTFSYVPGDPSRLIEREFNTSYTNKVDSKQFWMSHYGLREPAGISRTPPYWIIVLILGAGILLGALFLRTRIN